MQLLARLMDHVAAAARGTHHHRCRDVGRHRRRRGRGLPRPLAGRSRRAVSAGRISDVQRRMMTTAADDNVHALAIEGTFDDCQALVKAMFNHHAFRDRVRLSGVNSINWARIVAQVVYYFTAAVGARRAASQGRLHGADRKFRRRLCRLCRVEDGPADRPADGGDQRQRHPGAHASRPAITKCATSSPTTSPSMDIQVSSNFERLLFDAYGRDAASVRALMGSLAQSRRFAVSAAALKEMRAPVYRRRAPMRTKSPPPSAPRCAKPATCVDPHTAVALAVAEKEPRDPAVPMVVLSTAHPAKFPDAVEPPAA